MMADRVPEFIYFDLGNVLLLFDHKIACRQMAEVSEVPEERVREVVFRSGLELRYERGEMTSQEFYEAFCEQVGASPSRDDLMLAASAIFQLNVPMVSIVASLYAAQFRLGILSNTCDAHWRYASQGRYSILTNYFEVFALSFELKRVKPEPEIYTAAAELADVSPEKIFFTDDRLDNVDAAREAGFDAVQFTSAGELAHQLRARGVVMNL